MGSVLAFDGVDVVRHERAVLAGIDWRVGAGERWVLLGPNGSGKTTMLRLAGAEMRPTAGSVEILGRRVGQVDLRELRKDVALVSAATTRLLRPTLAVRDVVLTGKSGGLELWWEHLEDEDLERAGSLMAELGIAEIAGEPFGVASEGERQQALLARALMGAPGLLLLDEPAAGLDLPGREDLVTALDALAAQLPALTTVTVAHHLEDLPEVTTHAALLRAGGLVAAGPARRTLRAGPLSECFGRPLRVRRLGGRWTARGAVGLG